jgi:hypothetical protein
MQSNVVERKNFDKRHSEKMAMRKVRGGASRNKYGYTLYYEVPQYFIPLITIKNGYCGMPQGGICFSEAKKFSAIFPVALNFSLVLSLVSRQEKEHVNHERLTH